tara:strand:- start:7572 stop:8375 length:804 start_codon:yes stop_codon:yes gene_type:complete
MRRTASEMLRELEIRVARLERQASDSFTRTASFNDRVAAGKPYLMGEGLTKAKVREGEASMLYKIDEGKNQSKYYELLIVQSPQNIGGYTLIKRWGRLGPRFQQREEYFRNLAGAKAELAKIERSKTKKGYKSAFGDYHRAPDGRKLPLGQYPVGLESSAGSWRNQEVTVCLPVLRKLNRALADAVLDAQAGHFGQDLIQDLEEAFAMTADLGESMAMEVQSKLRPPLERLRGTNRRFKKDENTPKKIVKELKSLSRYLDLQLSLCN